ncbi:MAG: YscO family type III secretion system apparatus protein [Desulfovibrionaceae bacterium]|nr:YscO family type III secretion system apparatus protein [Desulfovibrionaceae bacterium]
MKDVYPLASILRVRRMHEEKAKDALQKAKNNVLKAKEDYEAAQERLRQYKEWRPLEEERRYAAIMGSQLSNTDLDTFRNSLAALGEEEVHLEGLCNQALKAVSEAEEKVREASLAVKKAAAECKKLETHREEWMLVWQKEVERQSDLEMEEVKSPQPISE